MALKQSAKATVAVVAVGIVAVAGMYLSSTRVHADERDNERDNERESYKELADYQLTAIWTYLRAVPCNPHNDALGSTFPWLQNKCN